ncbi:hypothetical protein ACR6C2_09715 [Streptomyces sp. INA 01156]
MFVVVTLVVAAGIALIQGCQGPAHGLGDDGTGVRTQQEQGGYEPRAPGDLMAERYVSTLDRDG